MWYSKACKSSKSINKYFTVNLAYWSTYVSITFLVYLKGGLKIFGSILDGGKK